MVWHHVKFTSLLACLLAGCVGLPGLHDVGNDPDKKAPPIYAPTTSQVIAHIECEIWSAFIVEGWPDDHGLAALKPLSEDDYVAVVNITLDETINKGFSPTASYIDPYRHSATPGSNFTLAGSPELTGVGHRNFTQSFTIDLDPKAAANTMKDCATEQGSGIKGKLGIEQVLIEGLRHRTRTDFHFPLVTAASPSAEQSLGLGAAPQPTFGTTIDFTLVYGLVSGGPNFTLEHFTGIGTPFNYTNTRKDTLILSFASAGRRDSPPGGVSEERATADCALLAARQPPESDVPLEELEDYCRSVADRPARHLLAVRAAQDSVLEQILQRIPAQ